MQFSKKHFLFFLVLFFLFILLRTAWISDDAFLTIRSVDNFVNGYGLRWNILERVQIYTHPLWMFLLSGIYYSVRNPLVAIYSTSIIISLVTVYLFGAKFAINFEKLAVGFAIFLFSKAFIDYSTSGLENPLTHLLILLFLNALFIQDKFSLKEIIILFFLASLIAANRMDTLLILIPSLLYILFKNRSFQAVLYAGIGTLPFLVWELFSLIYYGFPFPNTAYAKLATGIDKFLLIKQGFFYFQDSFLRDPITLVVIFTGILLALFSRKFKETLVAIGVILYLIYIIQIGGDFMSGRFFSALLLISTVLLMRSQFFHRYSRKSRFFSYLVLLIPLCVYSLNPYSIKPNNENGIADERGVYYSATSLFNKNIWTTLQPDYYWAHNGLYHKTIGKKKSIRPSSGMYSFYGGPELHVVDLHGLGDPLLSRLPPVEQTEFRIGHFFRSLPAGYWKFDRSFGNEIEDENLSKYYEKLSVLIHEEKLFSSERAIMIWRMNTGYYDYLLDAYLENTTSP